MGVLLIPCLYRKQQVQLLCDAAQRCNTLLAQAGILVRLCRGCCGGLVVLVVLLMGSFGWAEEGYAPVPEVILRCLKG
jgi:hypothetical protein